MGKVAKIGFFLIIEIIVFFAIVRGSEDPLNMDRSPPLTSDDKNRIILNTWNRVSLTRGLIDDEWSEDCYYGDALIYQHIIRDVLADGENTIASYQMYYDDHAKLIYVEVAHYRDVNYYMCFHDRELLLMGYGDYFEFCKSMEKGCFSYAPNTIKLDERQAILIQEDIAFCLGIVSAEKLA